MSSLSARRPFLLLLCTAWIAGCASGVSLDEPIEARTWRLVNIDQQPVLPGTDPVRDAQVSFDGGRVAGWGGCNRLNGSFQREGNRLRINLLSSTRVACADEERNALERRFMAALQAAVRYTMRGSEMVLIDANGQTRAILSSAPLR